MEAPKVCSDCKENVSSTKRSFNVFGGNVIFFKDSGHCIGCDNGFCDDHNYCSMYDDDVGGLGEKYWCLNCVKEHNESLMEKSNWCDNIPLLGGIIKFFFYSPIIT